MFFKILYISFIGAFISLDDIACWQIMISQPMISAPLAGLALGNVEIGILIGLLFQLLWLGNFPVGGTSKTDASTSSISTTAIIIIAQANGLSISSFIYPAVLLGIFWGMIGSKIDIGLRNFNSFLSHKAFHLVSNHKGEKVAMLNLYGMGLFWVKNFFLLFITISIGVFLAPMILVSNEMMISLLKDFFILLGFAVIIGIFISKKKYWFFIAGLLVGLVIKFWG
ncbi:MAG: PTS sugar transporter subunit IIC [bacterium]